MTVFTPEVRMYLTKCELEYIDEDYYETPYEQIIVDNAIKMLEKHLEDKDYEMKDEEELELLQLALLTRDKIMKDKED